VNQLLVWAKPSATKPELLNIGEVVSSMLALYRLEITKGRIQVDLSEPEERALILGNRQGIQQALANLILNAIQSMGEGGRLTLSTEIASRFDRGGMVGYDARENGASSEVIVVKISDTGVGIPPEIIPNLFKPFITSKSDGNGLGLSIVKEIIQAHQAGIFIETAVGEGTTFRLVFAKPSSS